jgi:hypothetical protein
VFCGITSKNATLAINAYRLDFSSIDNHFSIRTLNLNHRHSVCKWIIKNEGTTSPDRTLLWDVPQDEGRVIIPVSWLEWHLLAALDGFNLGMAVWIRITYGDIRPPSMNEFLKYMVEYIENEDIIRWIVLTFM